MKQLLCLALIVVTCLFVVPAHTATPQKKLGYSIPLEYLNNWSNIILIDQAQHNNPNPFLPPPDKLDDCASQCQCASILGKQNGAANNGTTCYIRGVAHYCGDYCGL